MNEYFIGLTKNQIQALQEADYATDVINENVKRKQGISFAWFREQFGKETGNWGNLNRGRAILQSTDQLDQYIYTHGLMIESQWNTLLKSYNYDGNSLNILDYGCGQGLAGIFLAGTGVDNPIKSAKRIVLIEASSTALARAATVYRALAPDSEIICVCKEFDKIVALDLGRDSEISSLHLFSNVLDIPGYDKFELLRKSMVKGKHTILAVSHDRNHDGGSDGIHSLDVALKDPSMANLARIDRSDIKQFECSNPGKSKAIYWHCDLEVTDG